MEYESDSILPYQYAKKKKIGKNDKRNKVERKKCKKNRSSNSKKEIFTNDLSSVTFMPHSQYSKGEKRDKVVSNDLSSSKSDDTCTPDNTSNNPPHVNCSCCNENSGEEMYECCDCFRKYHKYCHIPKIIPRREKRKKTWRCTICEDMNTISRDLGDDDDLEDISIGTIGRKIAERILMELYCNIDGSVFFRELPNKNVFPRYYNNIVRAVALNDVRDFLINKINYKLSEVVEDLKLVFVNAMSYFEVNDPNFNSARRLLIHLYSLYQSWIMYPSKNKQWTAVCLE